jgi:DNA (cytosine-5)-methyltransferase 1
MNLRHTVSLLPTPRASENENRQTRRTPSQEAGRHGLSLAAEVCELLPTPVVGDSKGARQATTANPRSASPTLTDLAFAGALLPTPTATLYGSNQSDSPGAAVRPSLNSLAPTLLPTPRASDGEKGGPNQRGSKGDLTLSSAVHRAGDATPPRSSGGRRSSDGPPPGQLTLWDG